MFATKSRIVVFVTIKKYYVIIQLFITNFLLNKQIKNEEQFFFGIRMSNENNDFRTKTVPKL